MEKIRDKFAKRIAQAATQIATAFVDSTCCYKLYQEELPKELEKLRKHD